MKKVLLILAVIAIGLTGCGTHSGNIKATDQNLISQIKVGKTTKDEVRNLLGDATNVMRTGNMEMWSYSYQKTDIGAKAFIPFVNLVGESAVGVKISSVNIRFDQNGIVQDVRSNTAGNK